LSKRDRGYEVYCTINKIPSYFDSLKSIETTCLYTSKGYPVMSKTLTLNDDTFTKIKWLKNRYEALEDGKSLTWDIFLNKLTEDSIIILSIKFKKKIPDLSLNDITTYLLGGFMSIDEVLKDESNNEIYTLLAKQADKKV